MKLEIKKEILRELELKTIEGNRILVIKVVKKEDFVTALVVLSLVNSMAKHPLRADPSSPLWPCVP